MDEKNKQNVIWKDIPGYEGLYQVSNDGRIYSLISHIELKQRIASNGYWAVGLHKNSIMNTAYIHQVVAKVFIGDRPDGMSIHHKNHAKLDNCADNLEYMPRGAHAAMHLKEAHADGRMRDIYSSVNQKVVPGNKLSVGSSNGRAKLDEEKVREILRLASEGIKQVVLSRKFDVGGYTINMIVHRKSWVHVNLSEVK